MDKSPLSKVKVYLTTHLRATLGELKTELNLHSQEVQEVLDYLVLSGRVAILKSAGGLEAPHVEEASCSKGGKGSCSCSTVVSKPRTQVFIWKSSHKNFPQVLTGNPS